MHAGRSWLYTWQVLERRVSLRGQSLVMPQWAHSLSLLRLRERQHWHVYWHCNGRKWCIEILWLVVCCGCTCMTSTTAPTQFVSILCIHRTSRHQDRNKFPHHGIKTIIRTLHLPVREGKRTVLYSESYKVLAPLRKAEHNRRKNTYPTG